MSVTDEKNRSVFSVLGASNHSKETREENDFYATDPHALVELLKTFSPHHNIWEPACGLGHLSEVLTTRGYDVLSTDIIDRGYGNYCMDFLQYNGSFDGDILTNPPYKYAVQFIPRTSE